MSNSGDPAASRAHAQGAAAHDHGSAFSVEAIQSLIVAFVLAMAFRSYVLEGFEIPTGSMAPTLMGAHIPIRSGVTGYTVPIDSGPVVDLLRMRGGPTPSTEAPLVDPMIGPAYQIAREPLGSLAQQVRLGDRVLVIKSLYPFLGPQRFDVAVFKNPTDPFSDAQNYIKRVVGIPDETILLLDGDVFAAPGADAPLDALRVQRKPEFIQRAVWQPVHDQDWQPVDVARLESELRRPWPGIPWTLTGLDTTDPRAWRSDGSVPVFLQWDLARRQVDDWTAYNMLRDFQVRGEFARPYPVSDLRVAASVDVASPRALRSAFELTTRGHRFGFVVEEGRATIAMARDEDGAVVFEESVPLRLPRGASTVDLEFWHVDEMLSLWVNGRRVLERGYDWTVAERIRWSFSGLDVASYSSRLAARAPSATPPRMQWRLDGSPLAMRRVRLDRDLYYRPGMLRDLEQFATNGEPIRGPLFATDPLRPGRLGPSHFLMLGDNSAASRDGRAWGRPHPLVAERLEDDTPFVVHRKLLLGKALVVYFPAPQPITRGGRGLIPDFGKLRFIR